MIVNPLFLRSQLVNLLMLFGLLEPAPTIYLDNIIVPPLDQDEVKTVLRRLNNNKERGADRLPAELFNADGEE